MNEEKILDEYIVEFYGKETLNLYKENKIDYSFEKKTTRFAFFRLGKLYMTNLNKVADNFRNLFKKND